jgi:hypothetical protein
MTSEVLFLPVTSSYRVALNHASQQGDVALGIIKTTSRAEPRYGIRFTTKDALKKFAADQGLLEQATMGKCTISGTAMQMRPEGIKVMMQDGLQWEIKEVLFMNDTASAVTAGDCPKANKLALKKTSGTVTIVHIKASNAQRSGQSA